MTATATSASKIFLFDDNVISAITTALQETLHEMCRLPCDVENSFVAQNWRPQGKGSGRIDLRQEAQLGLMQVHFAEDAALALMAKLLGRSPMLVNEETLDCIGAMTGIIYGRMKAILNPMGYRFEMAIPTMHFTDKLVRLDGDIVHLVIPFSIVNAKCFVELICYA